MAKDSLSRSDFYVYIIFRPNGVPCYVGKGRQFRDQVHEVKGSHNPHLAAIFKLAGGVLPRIRFKEKLTNKDALELEAIIIAAIGREINGGPLVNQTDGGEGGAGIVRSVEYREKQRKSQSGKVVSTPQRLNQCRSHLQRRGRSLEDIGQDGKHLSKFQRELIGKPALTKEEISNLLRLRNVGNKYGLGNQRTSEGQARVVESIRQTNSTRPITDEYRAKRREIAKAMWATRDAAYRSEWAGKALAGRVRRDDRTRSRKTDT